MNKLYPIQTFFKTAAFILIMTWGMNANAQCLVTTGPTNNCSFGDAIDNLVINSVTATNAGCSGTGTGYTYFPTPVWNFVLGSSYPISLTVGGGQYNQGVRIWLDANGNGIFETTESVYNTTAPALTHTGTLIVPTVGTTSGTVRMRVMCTYNTTATAAQACTSNVGNYGETEDYEVQLACSPPPQPTAASPVTICEGNTATLTASAPVGILNWYTTAVGGAPVGTGSPFTTPVLSSSTSYYVSDSTPGCPSARTQVDVVVNPAPIVSLGNPPAQCGGSVTLDAGNAGSTYLWSEGSTTQTIAPTTSGVYTATVTTAQGCTGTGSATVTIDQPSAAGTAVASAASYCEGSSVMLSTSGETGTITWVERAGSAGPFAAIGSGVSFSTAPMNTPGLYEYRAVATSGVCADDSSAIISVMIDSASVAGTASSTDSTGMLCAGSQIIFMTAGNTGNIDWYVSDDGGMTWTMFGSGNPYNPGPPSNQDTGMYIFQAVATSGACPPDSSNMLNITVNPSPEVMLGNDSTFCGSSLLLDAGNPGDMYMWSTSDTTQMITATASGTYTVDVTNSLGCMASDTIVLTINATPMVDLGPDTSYCASTVLDAGNAGSTYVWNTGDSSQTVTVTASGPYAVTVTGANGCTAWDSVNVTINQNPTVTYTSSVDTVCVTDAAFTLAGGSPAGGSYSGTGVSAGMFTPSVAGNGSHVVTYSYTDANGCSGTATQSVVVDACVGITDVAGFHGMQLFPNPTNGELNIIYNSGSNSRLSITVINSAGQLVYAEETEHTGEYRKTIDLTNESKGLYLVRIQNGDELVTGKVMVE